QLRQFKKMGSIKKIFSMLGLGAQLPPQFTDIAKDQMKRWEVVLQSMTKYEKENPKEIKGSRLNRIAIGSGVTRGEIKQLLNRFDMMNKFIKKMGKNKKFLSQLAKGGLPNLANLPKGFPGLPGVKPKKIRL
ncbi:MAG: signal recognition particle protein, partial [Promethearchaeota archaeon]